GRDISQRLVIRHRVVNFFRHRNRLIDELEVPGLQNGIDAYCSDIHSPADLRSAGTVKRTHRRRAEATSRAPIRAGRARRNWKAGGALRPDRRLSNTHPGTAECGYRRDTAGRRATDPSDSSCAAGGGRFPESKVRGAMAGRLSERHEFQVDVAEQFRGV